MNDVETLVQVHFVENRITHFRQWMDEFNSGKSHFQFTTECFMSSSDIKNVVMTVCSNEIGLIVWFYDLLIYFTNPSWIAML
jgi:hypothetical protein